VGALISSAAFALSSFATDVIHLHLCYGILGGIGFCFIYMPSVIIVGYYFEKWRPLATGKTIAFHKRPTYCYLQILILGIALSGSGVGTFIMAPISKMLIETYGWRGALLAQSGIAYALVDEFQC
jgi:MCP family monocarboxylic acid transporter-like MFS transporter 14